MNFRLVSLLVAALALFAGIIAYLDSRLEQFYVFTPAELHAVALKAIEKHGNDTRSVVDHIVGSLRDTNAAAYLNPQEEWIFNNAGGAMGAMYIIHASETLYSVVMRLKCLHCYRFH